MHAPDGALPDRLKAGIQALSAVSLEDVRVRYDSPEPERLDALGFAYGREIHVSPGQEHHLPHETWHLVQQAQGRVRPTVQDEGRGRRANFGANWVQRDWRQHTQALGLRGFNLQRSTDSGKLIFMNPNGHQIVLDRNAG